MKTKSSRLAKTQAVANLTGGLIIVVGLVPIVLGVVRSEGMEQFWMVLGGAIVALVGVLTLVIAALQIKIESNSFRLYGQLRDMHELSLKQSALLARIAENSALSDAARSLSNREMEIDRLRETIRTVIRTESWDAGIRLVDEMENRFGFTDEASVLRTEIEDARLKAMRTKFDQASQMIEQLFKSYDWEKAEKEIERLRHALPDEPRVGKLREALDQRKAKRKQELLTVWKNACGRDDVDEAIGVLRELDAYLTREEARELEKTARSVFKAKLLQLGTQFQFAVSEHRWRDALEVGVQITEEFPNSRMAKEVAEAMDGLRSRAGAKDVDVTYSKHTAET
ncbi:MAG: hypothetical protein DHS20C16_34170 [Phycisphaerae bacterium]|nr:MAG: hypothetical protein DHS20C16_34170 [Phycisphaerae bacterium]